MGSGDCVPCGVWGGAPCFLEEVRRRKRVIIYKEKMLLCGRALFDIFYLYLFYLYRGGM
jgi:hypothetical protein